MKTVTDYRQFAAWYRELAAGLNERCRRYVHQRDRNNASIVTISSATEIKAFQSGIGVRVTERPPASESISHPICQKTHPEPVGLHASK